MWSRRGGVGTKQAVPSLNPSIADARHVDVTLALDYALTSIFNLWSARFDRCSAAAGARLLDSPLFCIYAFRLKEKGIL